MLPGGIGLFDVFLEKNIIFLRGCLGMLREGRSVSLILHRVGRSGLFDLPHRDQIGEGFSPSFFLDVSLSSFYSKLFHICSLQRNGSISASISLVRYTGVTLLERRACGVDHGHVRSGYCAKSAETNQKYEQPKRK